MKQSFEDFIKVIEKLRSKEGCAWDKEQTIESMKKYVIEEANEIAEAIDKKEYDELKEEIGDLMTNLAVISQIAKEEKLFDMKDVLDNAREKLIRRHPHVFAGMKCNNTDEIIKVWNEIKEQEKLKKGGVNG